MTAAPTARWRRDTWRALSDDGRLLVWGMLDSAQRAALKAALREADAEDER
jgi:hypothetical protein